MESGVDLLRTKPDHPKTQVWSACKVTTHADDKNKGIKYTDNKHDIIIHQTSLSLLEAAKHQPQKKNCTTTHKQNKNSSTFVLRLAY